jgi:hypothetical protein
MDNRKGLIALGLLACMVVMGLFAEPALAAFKYLGDRVWMDLNGDGIQNCEDTNANGIIGDEGDTGGECLAAGIPGVTVDLVDCADPNTVLDATQTDASGFYQFRVLTPGEYCVRFDLDTVPDTVCGFGPPEFTTQDTSSVLSSTGRIFAMTMTVAAPTGIILIKTTVTRATASRTTITCTHPGIIMAVVTNAPSVVMIHAMKKMR